MVAPPNYWPPSFITRKLVGLAHSSSTALDLALSRLDFPRGLWVSVRCEGGETVFERKPVSNIVGIFPSIVFSPDPKGKSEEVFTVGFHGAHEWREAKPGWERRRSVSPLSKSWLLVKPFVCGTRNETRLTKPSVGRLSIGHLSPWLTCRLQGFNLTRDGRHQTRREKNFLR